MPEKVIFKKNAEGDVEAFFPQMAGTNDPLTMGCYAHVGQHCSACQEYADGLELATEEEYADLKRELERIGYELEVATEFTPEDRIAREYEITSITG